MIQNNHNEKLHEKPWTESRQNQKPVIGLGAKNGGQ